MNKRYKTIKTSAGWIVREKTEKSKFHYKCPNCQAERYKGLRLLSSVNPYLSLYKCNICGIETEVNEKREIERIIDFPLEEE